MRVHLSRTQIPYARHIGPLTDSLFDDVQVDSLFSLPRRDQLDFRKFLFVGAAGTKTNNHFDWSDNFVVCIQGIKHVALMPPASETQMSNISEELRASLGSGDCFYVDDGPNLTLDLNSSAYDPFSGSIAMHQHSVIGTCEKLTYAPLFPGDIVFFPAGWFHYFHNVTSTISVTIQSRDIKCM